MHPDIDDEDDEAPSKSARKRAHKSLQALGDELMDLSSGELAHVPLDPELLEAVVHGRGLRKGARVRQVRHLGNMLARVDAEPIREAVDSLRQTSAQDAARLHRLERWRERLLEEGDAALEELVAEHPQLDRQQLRALVRMARDERVKGAPPRRFRELLRFLRALQDGAD